MAKRTSPRKSRPLRVGDSVLCACADPHLCGKVCTVIGLRVRSCHGFTGVAVRYSDRGYSVLRPGEYERTN